MPVVLDASALIAALFREPGQEKVDAVLTEAFISTVNWVEVVAKYAREGEDGSGYSQHPDAAGMPPGPF